MGTHHKQRLWIGGVAVVVALAGVGLYVRDARQDETRAAQAVDNLAPVTAEAEACQLMRSGLTPGETRDAVLEWILDGALTVDDPDFAAQRAVSAAIADGC